MNQESSDSLHLKEYTCYEFINAFESRPPHQYRKLEFHKGQILDFPPNKLPTSIVDKGGNDKLYVMRWKFRETVTLNLCALGEQDYMRIQMNDKPHFINISDGYIYIVGGTKIYIMSLDNFGRYEMEYEICQRQCYYSLEQAFFQKEFGVILYSWNEKNGFKSTRFSPGYVERNNGFFSMLKQKLWTNNQGHPGFLKVIIPNILGIVFISDLRYYLIDLHQMKMIQNTHSCLIEWQIQKKQKIIVKYHQNMNRNGFDDSLIIGIGQKNHIQIMILNIKYDEHKKATHDLSQGLPVISELTNGYLIDWNQSQLMEYSCIIFSGQLIDFLLTDAGLFYSSQDNMIPQLEFRNYTNCFDNVSVVPLQTNIWSQYWRDQQVKRLKGKNQNFPIHRLLIPNRYSLQFLKWAKIDLFSEESKTRNHKKLLLDWLKNYEIKEIIIHNSDILVIRGSSISTLLPISQFQYQMEIRKISQIQERRCERGNDSQSTILSLNSSQYQPFQENHQFSQQLLSYERCLSKHNTDQSLFAININEFKNNIDDPLKSNNGFETKCLLFAQDLLVNRLKDIIQYYAYILSNSFNNQSRTSDGLSEGNGEQEQLIVHYLMFYSKVMSESLEQVKQFSKGIIDCLGDDHIIQKQSDDENEEFVSIDKECWSLISELFYDLIPIKSPSLQCRQPKINIFVRFLTKKLPQKTNDDLPKRLLYEMFSFLFTHNPQNIFLSNSIFFSICSLPPPFRTQPIYAAYLLRISSEIKEDKNINESDQFYAYVDAIKQSSNLPEQSLSKIQETLNDYYEMFEAGIDSSKQVLKQRFSCSESKWIKKLPVAINQIPISTLEEYLRNIQNDEELGIFFTRNIPSKELSVFLCQDQLQQACYGWALSYKVYVQKFNSLIEDINSQVISGEGGNMGFEANQILLQNKPKCLQYLKKAKSGLKKYQEFNQKLLGREINQEEQLKQIGRQTLFNKTASLEWMMVIQQVLEDQYFEKYTDINMICTFHIDKIISDENPQKQTQKIKKLHQFFSRKQIERMIAMSDRLLKKYPTLQPKTKALFGYLKINDGNTNLFNELPFRNPYAQIHSLPRLYQSL